MFFILGGLKMKNINGIKLSESDINSTIAIAIDLQKYGYTYNYFHKNYTSLLNKKDSKILWNKALRINS